MNLLVGPKRIRNLLDLQLLLERELSSNIFTLKPRARKVPTPTPTPTRTNKTLKVERPPYRTKKTNQNNKGLTTKRVTRREENLIVNISIDSTAAGGNLRKGSDVVEKDNTKVEKLEKKSETGLVDKVKGNLDDTKDKPESDFIKKDNAKLEIIEKKSGIDNAKLKTVEKKYGTGFYGTGLVDRVKEEFKLSNDDTENKKKSN